MEPKMVQNSIMQFNIKFNKKTATIKQNLLTAKFSNKCIFEGAKNN